MKQFLKILYSTKTTLVFLLIFTIAIGTATFIEERFDITTARKFIYNSSWLELILLLLAINFFGHIRKYNLLSWGKIGGLVFHLAFIFIIAGAGITRYTGYEGTMYIREGSASNILYLSGSPVKNIQGYDIKNQTVELPFSLYLKDFILERYAGTKNPSSYTSDIVLVDTRTNLERPYRIYMNNVLNYKGYRFFQSSYDEDEKGTILSVSHDFYGTWITYFGYFLLGLGFLITMLSKKSRFYAIRREMREIREKRKILASTVVILFFTSSSLLSQQSGHSRIINEHADRFGHLITQTYGGRFEPVHSLAIDVMHKISRKDIFYMEGKGKMNCMEAFLDIMIDPETWRDQKIIYIKEKSIQDILGIIGKYASFNDFFNPQFDYKLSKFADETFRKKKNEQNRFDKEILKVDERVNIFFMVINGSLLKIFPDKNSENNTWISWDDEAAMAPLTGSIEIINQDLQLEVLNYSNILQLYFTELLKTTATGDYSRTNKILGYIESMQRPAELTHLIPDKTKVNIEVFYNKVQIFNKLKKWYSYLAIVLLIFTFIDNLATRKNKFLKVVLKLFIILLGITFLYHTFGMGLRWYLSGHAPWSNGYEALLLAAWGTVFAGFCFIRNSKITLAGTSLMAFLILMTAGHSNYDPQLTNLQPVLKSYWLIIHVASMTISYGFLGLGFILGLFNLFIYLFKSDKNKERLNLILNELTLINEMNLTIGLILATAGTFLGAIWANESWGRYWGWDAKETWALIILIVYAMVLHLRLVPRFKNGFVFNVCTVFGFGSVLMTFIGVNYYLTKGMHSYAGGDTPVFPLWAWATISSILALTFFAWKNERMIKS